MAKSRTEYQRTLRGKKKAGGVCPNCPKPLHRVGDKVYSRCEEHLRYAKEYMRGVWEGFRKYQEEHKGVNNEGA